jgi:YegS/Rv2252/BmrU family lipid kinase
VIDVICNPVAGPKRGNRVGRIREFLSSRGTGFRVRETRAPGDAVLMAREAAHAGVETVIAAGGDGTVNEVANGLAGSATRLAVVPLGTGNVFGKEFSLPPTVEGCLALLEEGKTVSVPLAKANDRYFLLFASAGFDAEVVERMSQRQKNALGISAYVLVGLRHILRPQPTLWIELPGRERIEAQSVIVARGKKYGGDVAIAPAADIAGSTFQVVALLQRGRWAILRFALELLRGRRLHSTRVSVREAESLVVRSRIPSAAQVDGDYLGPLPVRFTVTGIPLRIVVPKEFPAPGTP